ncbi:recombinase family protein [Nguyenibacter vanlangensis]|uniref:Recombinase family protein n=1 Tax=Nguyenibacter vanlangensis TaxID=1216886 RepID=A0ABZ3D381_9PROT
MIYGYARVSTTDQSTEIQEKALRDAGAELVRSERVSATSRAGRTELETLLAFMRAGDILLVTRIDRLARSVHDLTSIVAELEKKGSFLRATEQPVDTSSPAGRAFLQMMGVFAELETAIRAERQAEGIAKAKRAGKYKGRPADMPMVERVFNLKAQGLGATEIARAAGITRAHVYRVLARQGGLLAA